MQIQPASPAMEPCRLDPLDGFALAGGAWLGLALVQLPAAPFPPGLTRSLLLGVIQLIFTLCLTLLQKPRNISRFSPSKPGLCV